MFKNPGSQTELSDVDIHSRTVGFPGAELLSLSAFLVGGIGVGAFLLFFVLDGQPTVIPSPSEDAEEERTSSHEYRDGARGFRFFYPPEWKLAETGETFLVLRPAGAPDRGDPGVGDIVVRIFENTFGRTIEEFYASREENFFESAKGFSPFRINDVVAVRFLAVPGRPPDIVVALKKDPYIIELTDVGSANQNNQIFNEILVSFEAIEVE